MKKFQTLNYLVTITTRFTRHRTGRPEMPQHRDWADKLTKVLRDQFDEQQIWTKVKNDAFFRKLVPYN